MKNLLVAFFLTCGTPLFAQSFHEPGNLVCSDCHTMHYSEDGTTPPHASAGGPFLRLLKRGNTTDLCLSCHDTAGSNATYAWNGSTPPKVKGTVANELPGGNFNYSAVDGKKGHSPLATGFSDSALTKAPGGHYPRTKESCTSCHDAHGEDTSSFAFRNLKKIGFNCNSCHFGYVPDSSTIASTDAHEAALVTPGSSADQNKAIDATNHNVYKGIAFGQWCGSCHRSYHGSTKSDTNVGDGTDWLRHPTGTALKPAYAASYGASTDFAYPIVTSSTAASTTAEWSLAAGESFVFCLSCHQAHASQYPNALRWDPTSGSGGTAGDRSKCGKCHDK